MMDGTQVNIDVTAPGATIALALIFLKVELASRNNYCQHTPIFHPHTQMLVVVESPLFNLCYQ